ncbi:hypothetical protein RCF19_22870 [Rhodococcus qingshengii]|nr:hypothetical protein EN35_32700 [Rhodococcus qingshengii]
METGLILGWLGLLGTIVGIVSLCIVWLQWRRTKRVVDHQRAVLLGAIERANHAKFSHQIIDELTKYNHDPLLSRWLWVIHQSGCDLYMTLVDEFLFHEKRFTYADLQRIRKLKIINGRWQYDYWLLKTALRSENKNTVAPADIDFEYIDSAYEAHIASREEMRRNSES